MCRRVCVKACRRVCWAGTGMALEEEERERSQRGASIGERGDVHGREAEGRGQVHMVCVCLMWSYVQRRYLGLGRCGSQSTATQEVNPHLLLSPGLLAPKPRASLGSLLPPPPGKPDRQNPKFQHHISVPLHAGCVHCSRVCRMMGSPLVMAQGCSRPEVIDFQ